MADLPGIGRPSLAPPVRSGRATSPLKQSITPGNGGRPKLSVQTAQLSPGGGPASGSPASPILRDTAPASPATPVTPSGGTFYTGGTATSINFMSINDESMLSLPDYVNHHNQRLIANRQDDIFKLIGTILESKKIGGSSAAAVAGEPKIGRYTDEEIGVTDRLDNDHSELIKTVLLAQGKDVAKNGQKLTTQPGERLKEQAKQFKQRFLSAVDDNDALIADINQLSDTAVNIFFQSMTRKHVPAYVGGKKGKKGKDRAAAQEAEEGPSGGALSTMTAAEMQTLITSDPHGSMLQTVLDEWKESLGENPSVAKVKGVTHARDWVQALHGSEEWAQEEDDTVNKISGLSDADLLAFWKLLIAQSKVLEKANKRSSTKTSKTSKTSKAKAGPSGTASKVSAGSKRGRPLSDDRVEESDDEDDEGLFVRAGRKTGHSSKRQKFIVDDDEEESEVEEEVEDDDDDDDDL